VQPSVGLGVNVERFVLPNHRLIGHEGGSQFSSLQIQETALVAGRVSLDQSRQLFEVNGQQLAGRRLPLNRGEQVLGQFIVARQVAYLQPLNQGDGQ
jgi:hypothetical protein